MKKATKNYYSLQNEALAGFTNKNVLKKGLLCGIILNKYITRQTVFLLFGGEKIYETFRKNSQNEKRAFLGRRSGDFDLACLSALVVL